MIVAASYIGTLPAWLTLAGVIGAVLFFRSYGGSTALASLETANRILEKRVHQLEESRERDQELIAELKGRTDVALAVKPIMEWAENHEDHIQQWTVLHEQRAGERHVAILGVLEQISARLGPTPLK